MRTTLLLLSLLCTISCSDYKLENLATNPAGADLPELDTAAAVPDTADPPTDLQSIPPQAYAITL